MNVNKVPVLGLFESKQRLEVPLFQRQYVWDRERQWAPLWEDIERKFCEAVEGVSGGPVHFLGAMVLDQKQTPVTHVGVRQVIDGQQRLTTLQLFLAAFRDTCSERGWDDLASECGTYLFNSGMMANPPTDRFKVWPTQSDRSAFTDVLDAGSKAELIKRHPLIKRKYARSYEPRHRMVEAYLYFRECLDDYFPESEIDTVSNLALHEHAAACFQALKSSLMVVVIDLDRDDDPQLIFETLNARGEPLLPADLLRNNIFLRARRDGLDIDNLYARYWRKFDEDFWRQSIIQGRLERPRSDLFLQHFLSSRQGQDIKVTQLYVNYRHWLLSDKPFDNVEDELATLARQGEDFRRIIAPNLGDPRAGLARFIGAFEVGTVYPMLLAMADAGLSDAQWEEVGVILESYLLRRDLCRLQTAGYNKLFLQFLRGMRKDNNFSPAALRVALLQQEGTSFKWPTDAEFERAFIDEPIYNYRSSGRIGHVLRRINDRSTNMRSEEIDIQSPLTIEHVMPAEWRAHWLLSDGSEGLSWDELDAMDEQDMRAVPTRNRDRLLHSLGNLTLMTQHLNSAQSNAAWPEKQDGLLHSLLPINRYFERAPIWDEAAIHARAGAMCKMALEIWPR